uniref:Uncharacterized protein n=1 Tax=Arundo donax TaxID=35708 RepID=A0A0A9B5Z5_ARUDO
MLCQITKMQQKQECYLQTNMVNYFLEMQEHLFVQIDWY